MPEPRRIACIAGARPNFMKIAPLVRVMEASELLDATIIHTGQHYDRNMSDVFLAELGIPKPAFNLGVGSGPQGVQTGQIMVRFEEVFGSLDPALVLVVGDVNSTIACALVSKKHQVPVAHVEAGLRSFDREMPEEVNRVLTDQLSDLLFTTEESAEENLRAEGIDPERIHFTGNTMIDTLAHMLPAIEAADPAGKLGVSRPYGVMTFHRPSNVDHPNTLRAIVDFILRESERIPIVFPAHPRTRRQLERFGCMGELLHAQRVTVVDPMSYVEFMALVKRCRFVITDSGGIQEETTWLGIPCLTHRRTTERPITVTMGTNTLLRDGFDEAASLVTSILEGTYKTGQRPPLWDGRCAERVVPILEKFFGNG